MFHRRSLPFTSSASDFGRVTLLSFVASAAAWACSAPPGVDGDPDFDGPPPFTGTPTGSGAAGNTSGSLSGAGGTLSGQPEGNPNPVGPVASAGTGGMGSSPAPVGSGGATGVPTGAGGAAAGGTGAPAGGAGGATAPDPDPIDLPEPPGEAFFFDDFEAGAAGQQPAAFNRWINYTTQAGNTLDGAQFALLDTSDKFRGNQSVHFHAEGATQPAMLTLALPANLTRVYVRAYVKTTRQVGNQTPDQESNHETLIGLRATPNDGNFEIRFGGAKGALGFNIVGPGRNDAVAPGQALWGSAPAISPNEWHCVELAFLNDDPNSPEAHASVDGQEVRAVTQLGDWHVPLSGQGTQWLNSMFREVIFGWQSFSPVPANDVWMDDIVLSESPIGCEP